MDFMGPKTLSTYTHHLHTCSTHALRFAQDRPVLTALILAGATTLVVPLAIGFTSSGIGSGSAAAAWQSSIGNVAAGSAFAILQSLSANGVFLALGGTMVGVGAVGMLTGLDRAVALWGREVWRGRGVVPTRAGAVMQWMWWEGMLRRVDWAGGVRRVQGVAGEVVKGAGKVKGEVEKVEWAHLAGEAAKGAGRVAEGAKKEVVRGAGWVARDGVREAGVAAEKAAREVKVAAEKAAREAQRVFMGK